MAALPGKSWSTRFGPQNHHPLAFSLVVIGHQAALLDIERAEALVLGPDTAYRPRWLRSTG